MVEREGGGPAGWEGRIAWFLGELALWNERASLVSRSSLGTLLQAHVLPSLAALLVVPADRDVRVLDVGSGGGFPGIPLGILRPRARLDLVEATRKKYRFLERCIQGLELGDARVHWCRIEAPTDALRGRAPFDVAIARAVGHEELVSRASRALLDSQGQSWVFTAPGVSGDVLPWADAQGQTITALRRVAGERA
ncbi:MAG: 16S rRNA (guanine(527)-N(7))-methyltransferase RsmG [bacterium]